MADKSISEKLKYLRNQAGMTQQQVADILGLKNKSTLGSWEIGISEPDSVTFIKLCKLYGVEDFSVFDDNYFDATTIGVMSLPEKHLLSDFRLLNSPGQHKAADYTKDLTVNPLYMKEPAAPQPVAQLEARRESQFTDITADKAADKTYDYTREIALSAAYRNKPNMRAAIDKLMDMKDSDIKDNAISFQEPKAAPEKRYRQRIVAYGGKETVIEYGEKERQMMDEVVERELKKRKKE